MKRWAWLLIPAWAILFVLCGASLLIDVVLYGWRKR